jgi:hypothetical protein
MVNLTHEEKLLLYTYICREFPSVVNFQTFETEEGLNKALLSFLEEIENEPWKYLTEDFLEKVDKEHLKNMLVRLISRIGSYWSYGSKEMIKNVLENLLKYTEDKQQTFSSKEVELVNNTKDKKLKAILARVNKLRQQGKIKV